MKSSELRTALAEIPLSQADFARLIGVTTRAVALWMSEARAVPGPAESYLRLFRLLPAHLRQIELGRLKTGATPMRDGMYGINFHGPEGSGMGLLVFDAGRVYGTDTQGVKYDGEYVFNENTRRTDFKVKVTFPPNVLSVFGISNPYEWAFDVTTSFDPNLSSGPLDVKSSIGQPLQAQYTFLRNLPDAA